MSQHAGLTAERWGRFTLGQQILQIAAEMQRGTSCLRPERLEHLRGCYERALALVDLTVATQARPGLRRELLRWRGVVAELWLAPSPDPGAHRLALRALLHLHPEAAEQVPYLAT